MFKLATTSAALVLVAAMSACERKPAAAPAPTTAAAPSAGLPTGLFLAAAPEGAREVAAAKPTLKSGDTVVLVGRIGGSEEPFVKDRAMFTLVDRGLKTCGEGDPDDSCETPWDYCCEPRATLTANSATVQVLTPEGAPAKVDLNGLKGLKPLAMVTVVGTVASADGQNVVVNASGFYVTQ